MARTFSIITTSKGRLEHLKATLPTMISQPCKEVIVVDYSCPEQTGEYVSGHFPSVAVVSVKGQEYFSNWRARNAGAAVANGDVLVFCDADTMLAKGAIQWLSENLGKGKFGFFKRETTAQFNRSARRLASNQLKGFHVIPTAAFRRVGGYDEVLEGYAAGGDTDLEERLIRIGLTRFSLDSRIIESVIEHGNSDRTKNHLDPIPISYCAGLLYRAAKQALLGIRRRVELPIELRQSLYEASRKAARALGSPHDSVAMTVSVDIRPIMMPRQLGYERGTQKVTLRVEVSMEDKIQRIPE